MPWVDKWMRKENFTTLNKNSKSKGLANEHTLDYLHFLAIMNKAAMIIYVQDFVWICFHIFGVYI